MSERRLRKVLVANRGEIAVRVIRACREMGIASVAVYSEADRAALSVRLADEARAIGGAPAAESYLRIDRILDAARASGADAVHPGYGFLAENPEFARACEEAGLAFIGPRSETIALMGEKTAARREAVAAGLQVVPGSLEPLAGEAEVLKEAESVGFPLMLKAAAGGGGKGMRLVASQGELRSALERARGEARGAFGDERVYVEKAIRRPRHIEIQIFGDEQGRLVHLFERECTIQRRHQKVIEESPSPVVGEELRRRMGEQAVALARRVAYRGAGTVEFLLGEEGAPYFLEINTRLQVEHPVTEMVTGQDLVKLQLRVARGEPLPFAQEELAQRGHAIECRIYAEDPDSGFLPSPGRIQALRVPGGPGIRDDSGVYPGWEVPVHYDPLISKLVAWGATREEAIARMRRAVAEYRIVGIKTTLPFFARLLRHPAFAAGEFDTSFIETQLLDADRGEQGDPAVAVAAAAIQAVRERGAARLRAPRSSRSPWWQMGIVDAHRARLGR